MENVNFTSLLDKIKLQATTLGFQALGISDCDLSEAEGHLTHWINKNFHADMHYMVKHGTKRTRPAELIPGTLRIISVRLDYLPQGAECIEALRDKNRAYISRYALGRDYHKVLKKKLKALAAFIQNEIGPFGYRAFVDSAPVMERAIAEKAGLGWIGKNSCVINKKAGSWFFLGELYTDLPLPISEKSQKHCGSCTACIDVCPTKAIVAPYQVDSRRCISYLTIENTGPIPREFRKPIGNRIYGCDDCQLCCPFNSFAKPTTEADFTPRHDLKTVDLISCFLWDEATFFKKTEGSAMRRISHESWIRNVAVALGNAPTSTAVITALKQRQDYPSAMVLEHIAWALEQHLGT
jgi:epoxyqueuosine reductase